MKAVFEELNGDVAVFILDDIDQIFYKNIAELPSNAQVNDVFEVEIVEEELKLINKLPDEREMRLKSNQEKRKKLLRRKKNLP